MHRSKLLLFLAVLPGSLILFSCIHRMDCSKVKNGKFYYYAKVDGRKIQIERKDSLQIEIDPNSNQILKSKIIWQDDCKFQMFVNAFSDTKLTKEDSLRASTAVPIEIVDIAPTYYVCIAKFSTSKKNYELRDTIYIQK